LSACFFVWGWHEGVTHEGLRFTRVAAGLSAALVFLTAGLILSSRKRPSFRLNLLAHFVLFGWLVSYAFPYLGEGP